MTVPLHLRAAPSGEPFIGNAGDTVVCVGGELWEVSPPSPVTTLISPVYVEVYLPAAGGDLRTAFVAALADNPLAVWFIFPVGSYNWPGALMTEADGLRSNLILQGQNTRIFFDEQGLPSGQKIFWLWANGGTQFVEIFGFHFSHLNVNTSLSSYAFGIISAIDCSAHDCIIDCTLAGGVTAGHTRWGASFFGSTNCVMRDIVTDFAELGMCTQGASCLNAIAENLICNNCNDVGIAIVSTKGSTVQNVQIRNVAMSGLSGSTGIFVGTDGAGAGIGVDLLRNVLIDGVQLCGSRNPDTSFNYTTTVFVAGGAATENVQISHVSNHLDGNAVNGGRGVLVLSQDDETSWIGLVVGDLTLGIATSASPLQTLYIGGNQMSNVILHDIYLRGANGVFLTNIDGLQVSNVNTDNGTLFMDTSRNLSGPVQVSDCVFRAPAQFAAGMTFRSLTGNNYGTILVSDVLTQTLVDPCRIDLHGGSVTNGLFASDCYDLNNNNLLAETLAALTSDNCVNWH